MFNKNENKLEKESIKVADYRVWKQRQNLSSEDIIHNILRNQSKIKNYTEALNEEEKNDKKKKIKIIKVLMVSEIESKKIQK